MSHSTQPIPTVTTSVSGSKQKVNLRDYLNQRIAPFLKNAIHDGLDIESVSIDSFVLAVVLLSNNKLRFTNPSRDDSAEFPLQWLGEHLIQQSIWYEGNPDRTNIRERFVYKHEDMTKQTQQQEESSLTIAKSVHSDTSITVDQQMSTGIANTNDTASSSALGTNVDGGLQRVNGVSATNTSIEQPTNDTEMSGTS